MERNPDHSLTVRWVGLFAGPLLALLVLAGLPDQYRDAAGAAVELGSGARATLALMVWMAVWWMTEAIPLPATSLLPIAVLPLAGAASAGEATAPYADKLIFLFLGGFVLALSMQRWGLDRRIALRVLRLVGTRPVQMVGGVMLVTAFLSMFVSNTATAAMMLPIALSVVTLLAPDDAAPDDLFGDGDPNFGLCMMLGIAYAATIGGIGTKIGTPPNGLLLGFIERNYGREIDFVTWLGVGLPLVAVFLPTAWWLLTRAIYPVPQQRVRGAEELLERAHRQLGPLNRGERVTLLVFVLMAAAWVLRPILANGYGGEGGLLRVPALLPGLTDAGIAIGGAILLFSIPADWKNRTFTMNWDTARALPWGVLLLFGGGLSLAAAVKANGVDLFIGSLAHAFGALPTVLLVVLVTTLVILLTELTSNTATTATLLPVLAPAAVSFGVSPYMLIVPAALAASCAFMLPVATPPNAVVFGSGYVTIRQMTYAGLWLNLLGIVFVTVLMYTVVVPLLGIDIGGR
ncbi:MAG: DASS family sodium-coupled anion symporter [Deltaproteobacteria bacterium]|nr:MAG: DASS family sodium-coupled anion symporter [Deltaproteobacteria bacterium]